MTLAAVLGFTAASCTQPESNHAALPSSPTIVDMTWGNVGNPQDSQGFGMSVTLRADGQLSCQYSFSEGNWGFIGSTSSTGRVTPDVMKWLERTFTDSDYLALPDEMPSGTSDSFGPEYRLMTSFQGKSKSIRLVPGEMSSEAENNRLMQSVDAIFDVCPTRPRTPIYD